MALKTLVTVHSVDAPIDALKPVISLAVDAGAHLNVVVLGMLKTPPMSYYGGVPDYYLTEMHDELRGELKKRAQEVEALALEADLSASVLIDYMEVGLIRQRMSAHALYSDLVVFPHGDPSNGDATSEAFSGILFESGTPVLILGNSNSNAYPFRRAVLAWDFEPPASKAIRQTLPLLPQVQDVHVLMVDPVGGSSGSNPGDDIATFLARHGLQVTVDLLPSAGKDVAGVIVQHAVDKDADLIVMGGYGHSRLREWLLGGTTRDILQNSRIPVLMMH